MFRLTGWFQTALAWGGNTSTASVTREPPALPDVPKELPSGAPTALPREASSCPPLQLLATPETTAEVVARILGSYTTTIVDVGARWGMDKAWWRIPPLARLVGFDPDAEECARLNQAANGHGHERFVPLALGRTAGPAVLHHTVEPACSSLYPPDLDMMQRYAGLWLIRPVGTSTLPLTTLAAWAVAEGISEISFLKLDTQGSELDILHGAETLLHSCLGIEIEVEFAPLYQGQPLFADVDTFLRPRGFVLWRLSNLAHYAERLPTTLHRQEVARYDHLVGPYAAGNGRLLWANALYFRDYRDLDPNTPAYRQLLLLAALFHAAGDHDATRAALQRCLEGSALPAASRELLMQHVPKLPVT